MQRVAFVHILLGMSAKALVSSPPNFWVFSHWSWLVIGHENGSDPKFMLYVYNACVDFISSVNQQTSKQIDYAKDAQTLSLLFSTMHPANATELPAQTTVHTNVKHHEIFYRTRANHEDPGSSQSGRGYCPTRHPFLSSTTLLSTVKLSCPNKRQNEPKESFFVKKKTKNTQFLQLH